MTIDDETRDEVRFRIVNELMRLETTDEKIAMLQRLSFNIMYSEALSIEEA